jgi:hypothetical protein
MDTIVVFIMSGRGIACRDTLGRFSNVSEGSKSWQ